MKKSIESNIRLNVFLIYALVAIICGTVFFYFYSSSRHIGTKRITVEEYNRELGEINKLIHAINQAQGEASLYVGTKRNRHLRNFRRQVGEIESKIDSIKAGEALFIGDSILSEISVLLKEKGRSMTALNLQFNNQTLLDSLSLRLQAQRPLERIEMYTDTSIVTTYSDTLVQAAPKKSFMQRLSNVFSPQAKEDTIVTVAQTTTNVIKITETDTLPIQRAIEEAREDYSRHISRLERQVGSLILADQDISSKLSDLLIQLYSQIVNSRLDEIEAEETVSKQNNIRMLIGGGFVLLVILLFIIFIIHDVNKGYKARIALEEANKRTRQLMESRHQLLLSVAHDVKTPLNSILGYLELSRQKQQLSAKEIVSMRNSGKHILALLNNLLDFSRLEQGTLQLVCKNFSLLELCDELYDMFAPLAETKKLSFTYDANFNPELILYSDPLRIRQIITNILSNAIKYTQEGSIFFVINYHEEVLTVVITDTGVGIPIDKQEKIYLPFTRVDENSALAEGSGFGLYVVKGLVDLFEGELYHHSSEGNGTRVTVHLNVKKGEQIVTESVAGNLLIIDDDGPSLTMMRQLCEQLGHHVVTCQIWAEFEKALTHLADFDTILTDMEMGYFSGKDVLTQIRERDPEKPVILASGRMDYHTDRACIEGFTGFLEKPVTLKNLRLLIGGDVEEKFETESLFDETSDEMIEVIEQFLYTAINHLVLLKEGIEADDFDTVHYVCHKMTPMFLLLEADKEIITILWEIDIRRPGDITTDYLWKEKITRLIDLTEAFLGEVQEKYLP
ncbi:hybrid sensor histidine kinase/response regulator [Parabacteroides sp. PF5-9]|uniref:hybrid sensor histidine kinase/response regulator n=1 Tax=Parabacteroides sp. PF5-9 TaxID=1742404 RepID=UPI0024757060|nr:hybrid sensor histidine kinase/response regulator [Parabacteroides sp. PF5-9]MDH6357939.1 two-component system sensor histidine kinase EvgS [Parabacteroides sp. PF5-9]